MTHMGGNHFSLGRYNMDCYFDEAGFYARLGEAVMRFDRLEQAIPPPEKAAEYTGEYFSPELKTRYIFTVEAGVLTGREWRDEANPCYMVAHDQFICRFGRITERLFFRRDQEQRGRGAGHGERQSILHELDENEGRLKIIFGKEHNGRWIPG